MVTHLLTLLLIFITISSPFQLSEIGEGVYSYSITPAGSPQEAYFSLIVITPQSVVCIESVSTEQSKGMLEAVKTLTDKPVTYLLQTHNHWDHTRGGQVFRDVGATIVAHSEAKIWMEANPDPEVVIPDIGWKGKRVDLTADGVTIEGHYMGLNHGTGMTVFVLPQTRIAYIADLATKNRIYFAIMPDYAPKELERTLREIVQLNFDRVVFSHNSEDNGIEGGTKQDVQENLNYLVDLRAEIRRMMRSAKSPADLFAIPSTIQLPKYQDWTFYKEFFSFNVWKILAEDLLGPQWQPKEELVQEFEAINHI